MPWVLWNWFFNKSRGVIKRRHTEQKNCWLIGDLNSKPTGELLPETVQSLYFGAESFQITGLPVPISTLLCAPRNAFPPCTHNITDRLQLLWSVPQRLLLCTGDVYTLFIPKRDSMYVLSSEADDNRIAVEFVLAGAALMAPRHRSNQQSWSHRFT